MNAAANPSLDARRARMMAAGITPATHPSMQPVIPGSNMQAPKQDKQGPSKKMKLIVLILLLLVALLVALLLMQSCSSEDEIVQSNSGIEVVNIEGMTEEEAQAAVNAAAIEGMMDVHIARQLRLNGNSLYVEFRNPDTNKKSQVLTIMQNGKTIVTSNPCEPGYGCDTIQLTDAMVADLVEGEAQVTISYVDDEGELFGNGAMFATDIVIES